MGSRHLRLLVNMAHIVRSSRILTLQHSFRSLRFSAKRAMSLKVGDEIPSVEVFENNTGNKVVIFAVPGAFTPGCSKTHLPGYVANASDMKGKGIDEIVCVSVNDPFVMEAWGQAHSATDK